MLYRFFLILLCFVSFSKLNAQTSLLKKKWVGTGGVYLDSTVIFPNSLQITATYPEEMNVDYLIDEFNRVFLVDTKGDTIRDEKIRALIHYRIYPKYFSNEVRHRSQDLYQQGKYGLDHSNDKFLLEIEEKQKREELFSSPNIEKTGSLSRGLSMGNSQDVFMNSAMNLQLKGNITDDVELTAVLTDQDIPFQPEGNTQQIQDFDKVYIGLKHDNAQLAAGDIVMQNNPGVFLKYNKNVQGVQGSVFLGNDSSKVKTITKGGVSIAKGQFYSADIMPIDGVLGPYRLFGPNGENNIIVIANSEKVYIDGELLQRGFDADYVIDYNTSEVTFTEKILITQYTRVRIDYEYATQYYSRSIVEANHQFISDKWNSYFNFYQEKDDRNSSLFYSLSDEDKKILAAIGDSLQYAFAPSIDSVVLYDPNRILYTIVDTVMLNGENTTCLRRAGETDLHFYSAGFSDVGEGNGDYIMDEVTSFGRYYKWVSPENGIRKGRYLPIRKLVAPNSKQMMTVGGDYKVTDFETVSFEMAFSNQNENLFSTKNNDDNKGNAYQVALNSNKRPLTEKVTLSTHAALMYLEKDFTSIDRFRSIEFDRNWALNYDEIPKGDELYLEGGVEIRDIQNRKINYQYSHRDRENIINGYQQELSFNYHFDKINFRGSVYDMESQLIDINQNAEWEKLSGEVFYNGENLVPGYKYKLDQQETSSLATDSIVYSWMNYQEHQGYIRSGDSLGWNYQLSYTYREDNAPKNGKMELQTLSNIYNLDVGKTGRKGNIQIGATYRKWIDYFGHSPSNEESIQGRLAGGIKFGKGIGKFNGTYTVSSSRELMREFVYVRVEDGKGTHTWRDLNGDGIKDQNEFFLAQNPDERQYARFYTPTDTYIPAYRSTLNLRLLLKAPNAWKKSFLVKKFASKFSNNTSLLVDKKSLTDEIWGRFSPFPGSVAEEDMLAYNFSLRNALFFNRNNPIYGADFRVVILENTQLLTQGREERKDQKYTLGGRLNVNQMITLRCEGYQRDIFSGSDYLSDRNYTINEIGLSPSISFQPNLFMRYTFSYEIKNKLGGNQGDDEPIENAQIQETSLEAKWSKATLFTITAKCSAIFQTYDGETNSALGYEMLDALNPGTNFKWNVAWTQSLFDGMQLRIQYDGRRSQDTQSIHIGSMNLIALF